MGVTSSWFHAKVTLFSSLTSFSSSSRICVSVSHFKEILRIWSLDRECLIIFWKGRGVRFKGNVVIRMMGEITDVDPCRGRIQIIPERLDVGTLCLSVHHNGDEPANVEHDLYEVRILGQCFSKSRGSLRGAF
jgi:hypothetical protein